MYSVDFGGELSDGVTHIRRELGMLRGRLAFQGFEGHGQFDRLDHAGTGDSERLAGRVVRPDPAVLTEGPPDDRQRLALQRAVAEGPGQPVDRVLDDRRKAA